MTKEQEDRIIYMYTHTPAYVSEISSDIGVTEDEIFEVLDKHNIVGGGYID